MSEQASRNSLGGNTVLEIWQGLTMAQIEAKSHERGFNSEVYLETMATDHQGYEEKKQALADKIDMLLVLYGINPTDWPQRVLSRETSRFSPQQQKLPKGFAGSVSGRRLGNYLHGLAAHALPIEDQDDGYGNASLTLQLTEELIVELSGEGDFWTGRTYIHPVTEERLYDGQDSHILTALREEEHYLDPIDSRVDYQIRFNAYLGRVGQQSQICR